MNFSIKQWKKWSSDYTLRLLISGQNTKLGNVLWSYHPWSTMKNYSMQHKIFYRKAGMPNATHPRSLKKGGSSDLKCFQLSSVPDTFPTTQISVFVTRNPHRSGHQSNLLKIKWRMLCELWVTYWSESNPPREKEMHRLQILLGPMSFSLVKTNMILGNLKAGQCEGTAPFAFHSNRRWAPRTLRFSAW